MLFHSFARFGAPVSSNHFNIFIAVFIDGKNMNIEKTHVLHIGDFFVCTKQSFILKIFI